MKKSYTANCILILVTIIWGLTFPAVRDAMQYINPYVFVAVRLLTAGLILLPFIWMALRKPPKGIIWAAFIVGIFSTMTYTFQSLGLETIGSARSAFITGFTVVLVPLLQPLFGFNKPTKTEALCAAICFIGIFILTGANFDKITIGDIWTFCCATTYALSILCLQVFSPKFDNELLFTFLQIIIITPFTFAMTIGQSYHGLSNSSVIAAILFCSILATCVAIYLQVKYQKKTTAAKAALIYALEPVFATIFGFLINHEAINTNIFIGGGIILLSLVLPAVVK